MKKNIANGTEIVARWASSLPWAVFPAFLILAELCWSQTLAETPAKTQETKSVAITVSPCPTNRWVLVVLDVIDEATDQYLSKLGAGTMKTKLASFPDAMMTVPFKPVKMTIKDVIGKHGTPDSVHPPTACCRSTGYCYGKITLYMTTPDGIDGIMLPLAWQAGGLRKIAQSTLNGLQTIPCKVSTQSE